MKTPHLLAYALSTPWAMMPERMAAYAAVLARHYAGDLPPAALAKTDRHAELMAEIQAAVGRGASGGQRSGGIAVVPVFGSMVEWASQIDMCDGGTSTRAVSQALTDAENDETISQILMVFSTPGGSVYGTSETADVINRVKATKPVIGVAQSLAASAGYWLLSQCTEAYCAPGGEVGSIGVYSGYENIAKALEAAGIDVELFSAGQYKTELSPFSKEGLTPEARAYQIQRANDYFAMFTKGVAKGRGKPIDAVRNGMGQGRVLGADAALAAGMIDGVMTMEQVIRKMQRTAAASSRSARADDLSVDVNAAAQETTVADAPAETVVDVAATVTPEQLARASAARARALDLASL
jgi:capsid assembly protease